LKPVDNLILRDAHRDDSAAGLTARGSAGIAEVSELARRSGQQFRAEQIGR
jgi:hypothetical protein